MVNTDGDNQYKGSDIAKLIKPILNKKADIVIGCRPIDKHPDFSWGKKKLQKIGSLIISKFANVDIEDAASGFRAYNKEAMLFLNVFSRFSYCLETLIQAGNSNLKISSVDIGVNKKTRESRLFKSPFHYLWQSGKIIFHIFLLYKSSLFFAFISLFLFLASLVFVIRYLILTIIQGAAADVFWPTVVLAGILLLASLLVFLSGVLSSLIAANRRLSEEILYKLRKQENVRDRRHLAKKQ